MSFCSSRDISSALGWMMSSLVKMKYLYSNKMILLLVFTFLIKLAQPNIFNRLIEFSMYVVEIILPPSPSVPTKSGLMSQTMRQEQVGNDDTQNISFDYNPQIVDERCTIVESLDAPNHFPAGSVNHNTDGFISISILPK